MSRGLVTFCVALVLPACASARDVAQDGKALEARLAPERRGYCPPEALARGLAEIGFARTASERGDGLAAASHLSRAEAYADEADRASCVRGPAPIDTPGLVVPKPQPAAPDLDQDGIPDALDPDDDGDGANDSIDQCPTAAEDVDGFEDIDGCPDPDAPPQVVPN